MLVETTDDLLGFFDLGEFAVAAIYTLKAGQAFDINAILTEPDRSISAGVAGIRAVTYTAKVPAVDLPASAKKDDTLTIGNRSFVVRKVLRSDRDGIATLEMDPSV